MTDQPFVGRENELARLWAFLDAALGGRGQICFVGGQAGGGKTSLAMEFSRRAQQEHDDLVVAVGQSDAQTGAGDAYLPFRDILGELTGDFADQLQQGLISRENASRLRGMLGLAADAIIEIGPELVGLFVPGAGLALRGASFFADKAGLLAKLRTLTQRKPAKDTILRPALDQDHILEQYTNVLRSLATARPLLLILDDLHWADAASIDLLFRLGRRISASRIVIIGTYRKEEVALDRAGDRHPLEKVLAEFGRYFGDIEIDLDVAGETEGRQFVDELLDSEPNQLGKDFRQALFARTQGHPLFTVELVRHLREQGELQRDESGRWIALGNIDWELVPARVEGVIKERIGRLGDELRDLLAVASIEGVEFTAEVLATVQEAKPRDTVRLLSTELARRHRVVSSLGTRRIGSRHLSIYRFTHSMIQQYVYQAMDEPERRYLHADVGTALEAICAPNADQLAVQLARHFVEAGFDEKAAHYLHRAGQQAAERLAPDETLAHLTHSLALTPDADRPGQRALRIEIGAVLATVGRFGEAIEHLTGAYELFGEAADLETRTSCAGVCYRIGRAYEQMGGTENLDAALSWQQTGLCWLPDGPSAERALLHSLGGIVAIRRPDLELAQREGERALAAACEAGSAPELALAHRLLSISHRAQGSLEQALAHCDASIDLCLTLGDQVGLATNYLNRGVIAWEMDDWPTSLASSRKAAQSLERIGSGFQLAVTYCNLGDAYRHLGDLEPGITYARRGLSRFQEISSDQGIVFGHIVLSALLWRAGDLEGAQPELARAREISRDRSVGGYEATLARWSAQVYLAACDLPKATQELERARSLAGDDLGAEAGPVTRLWGTLLAAQGREAEAIEILERTLGEQQEKEQRYEAALSHMALGRTLQQAGRNLRQAADHARQAQRMFAELGARLDERDAAQLLAEFGS